MVTWYFFIKNGASYKKLTRLLLLPPGASKADLVNKVAKNGLDMSMKEELLR